MSRRNLHQILKENDIEVDTLELLLLAHNERELYGLQVPRLRAMQIWHQLQNLFSQTSYWPILTFDKLEAQNCLNLSPEDFYQKTTAEVINLAETLDIDLWLKKQAEENPFTYQDPPRCPPEQFKDSDNWWCHRNGVGFLNTASYNDWGIPVPDHNFLILVPVKEAWHIAAALKLHVWNNGLLYPWEEEQVVHTALFKKWQDKYGAELLSICPDTSNSLEFKVTKPPQDRTEALKLAWEQFVYCDDVINQGAYSLDHLAESLIGTDRWVFWWD